MNAFTIKDLENLTGIKAHTIRIWEQRYNFLKPQRTDTNIRYYNNEELKKILNISLLNKNGFKISHIDRMSDNEINEKILSISSAEAQQEQVVNSMIQYMVDIELGEFERLLREKIESKGIEKVIHHYIFPFMERIGLLWVTGHINPAQEHLVSNIIRHKLIVGTEAVNPIFRSNKRVLLFMPDGEYHELGLLFIQYLLKNRGIEVFYLGASVPLADVAYVVKHKKPDFIYTHMTTASRSFNFERFMNQAVQKFGDVPFVISGPVAAAYESKIPSQVKFKRSLPEVMDFINQITLSSN